MESEFEQHERVSVDSGVMTKDQLTELVYKNQSFPEDQRFLPTEDGGVFQYFDIGDLTSPFKNKDMVFPFVKEGETIVGLAKLQESEEHPGAYAICFISVDPKYQDKGYGTALAEQIIKFAKQKNVSLAATSYSELGMLKMKPVLNKLASKQEVNFIDTDNTL